MNVDEGLMLDINGYVSTCNSTNFFIIKDNQVFTSCGKYCLNGVTRGKVIEACKKEGIIINQVDFTLDDVHSAHEAFVTGTFAGIIPVISIDKHQLSGGKRGDLTQKLQFLYQDLITEEYSGN
jgi:branched-chain amino acid aminotransferase